MDFKKIFIINGGQVFGHSGGRFNQTITNFSIDFLGQLPGVSIRSTNINEVYDANKEVENFVWADLIIYHTPIWWFQVPNGFKKYIDEVFTAGHQKGIYHSDGRSSSNPDVNYGTGGMLHGRHYLVTSSWNAPATPFTLPGEFFNEKSVDEGVLFGFHRMNAFVGMKSLPSFHFHDVEKNPDIARDLKAYQNHLIQLFSIKHEPHEHLSHCIG